jgi:hypothetical protein
MAILQLQDFPAYLETIGKFAGQATRRAAS